MLFYARVCWGEIGERTDEMFFNAKDYTDAVIKIKKYFGDVIAMSLYPIDDDVLLVADYENYLDEARKATM